VTTTSIALVAAGLFVETSDFDDSRAVFAQAVGVPESPDGVLDGAVITMTDAEGPAALVFLQLEGDVNVYLAHKVGTEFTTDELISIVAAKLPAYRTWVEGCVRDHPSRSDECAGVEAYL
jgi:hypothetical protein